MKYIAEGRKTPSQEMCYAKLQVRHILFKKIVFLIFLNNPVTVHCARAYCLKRKKQKTFFSFQSMP